MGRGADVIDQGIGEHIHDGFSLDHEPVANKGEVSQNSSSKLDDSTTHLGTW